MFKKLTLYNNKMEKITWSNSVKESNYLGRIHPDTYNFSDLPKLNQFKQIGIIPQMKKIEVYHDTRLVFGYEVTYEKLSETAKDSF